MAYEFIPPQECLGDSLAKINNNAAAFDTRIINLTNTIATLSAALNAANLALTLAVSAAAPIGAVQTFAMASAPTGWLECNGVTIPASGPDIQGVSVTLLQTLRTRVGTTYGVLGKLPDLRGEFVRGWDNSRGIDSGRTFGTNQQDAFQGHWHSFRADNYQRTAGSNPTGAIQSDISETYNDKVTSPISDGSNGTPRTASETRPRNVALLYCIKY